MWGGRGWGRCYGLSSLGDRLQDGDLWARTEFGGVLGTDTWGWWWHRETFGCGGLHDNALRRDHDLGPSRLMICSAGAGVGGGNAGTVFGLKKASGSMAWHFASGSKTEGARAQGSKEMVSEMWKWNIYAVLEPGGTP